MLQVMCSRDVKRLCDGSCDYPGCIAKHRPKITVACGECDRLRAERDALRDELMLMCNIIDGHDVPLPIEAEAAHAKGLLVPPNDKI